MFLDTQIVSYAMKGRWNGGVVGAAITSIVANELLLVQSAKPSQANYYVPHPSRVAHLLLTTGMSHEGSVASLKKRTHPFRKQLTDSLVIEFGQEHPTIVEYGNFAIAEAINERYLPLFGAAVNFMEKRRKKVLMERFRFLLDRGIRCEPIRQADVGAAFELLARFKKHHNLKGVFRNTWNDILILAASRNRGEPLVTRDNELSRFAAETYAAAAVRDGDFLCVSFPKKGVGSGRGKGRGTNGYVNSGWLVRFRDFGNRVYR